MRLRLVESAARVFADRGTAGSVVQEVIAQAKFSQGTFYNYFRANEKVLLELSQDLNDELIALIELSSGEFVDPAKRIATGVRQYLSATLDCPVFARLMSTVGLRVLHPNSLLLECLPEHITRGEQTGRFEPMPLELALDVITGTTLAAVVRIDSGPAPPNYPELIAAALLRGLGVPGGQANRLVRIELPPIEATPGSLLARLGVTVESRRPHGTVK